MGKAQFAGEIVIGKLVLRGKLYPVRSDTESMTKTVHESNKGEVHTLSEDRRQFCKICNEIIAQEKVRSAVPINGQLVVLDKDEVAETAGEKALIFTERLGIGNLHLTEIEKAYWFVPDPESEKWAADLYAFIVGENTTFGGDLVVSGATRKSYLFPWHGRLYLLRSLYGEEVHKEPEGAAQRGAIPSEGTIREAVARVQTIIGHVPYRDEQEVIAQSPRRLTLRDIAKAKLSAKTRR